jgi:hypothetical protein
MIPGRIPKPFIITYESSLALSSLVDLGWKAEHGYDFFMSGGWPLSSRTGSFFYSVQSCQ